MTPRGPEPDARETLLLRAALLDGDVARDAWRAWRADADLDRVDQATFRLLPLAWRNLERLGVADPWSGTLRGFYRRAWSENQVLFRRVAGVLERLNAAGIDTLVLKGAALVSQAYGDAGARPMSDADLLVPRRRFVDAVGLLRAHGWAPVGGTAQAYDASPRAFVDRRPAIGLRQTGDALSTLDVHHRILRVFARHSVDVPAERLFADAEPFEFAGVPARRLSAEHALLHTCFHGYQRQDVGPIRWVADADRLLRARGATMRWDRLLADARTAAVVSPLRDALPWLAAFGTPVDAAALSAVRRTPLAFVDRLERAMRVGAPTWLSDVGKSVAPALRRMRERGADRRPNPGRLVREAWRLAVRLPRRHVQQAARAWFARRDVPRTGGRERDARHP